MLRSQLSADERVGAGSWRLDMSHMWQAAHGHAQRQVAHYGLIQSIQGTRSSVPAGCDTVLVTLLHAHVSSAWVPKACIIFNLLSSCSVIDGTVLSVLSALGDGC